MKLQRRSFESLTLAMQNVAETGTVALYRCGCQNRHDVLGKPGTKLFLIFYRWYNFEFLKKIIDFEISFDTKQIINYYLNSIDVRSEWFQKKIQILQLIDLASDTQQAQRTLLMVADLN